MTGHAAERIVIARADFMIIFVTVQCRLIVKAKRVQLCATPGRQRKQIRIRKVRDELVVLGLERN